MSYRVMVTRSTSSESTNRSGSRSSRRAFLGAVGSGAAVACAGCMDVGSGPQGGTNGSQGGTVGSPGADSVTLTWWHQENVPHRIEVFRKLNEEFMNEYPNIEVQAEPQTWGGVFAKLQSALNAGNAPDFWFTTPVFAQEFQARDQLADVSGMMDDLDSQYNYIPKAKKQYQYKNGVWGIPNWNKGFQYYWRNNTFDNVNNWPPKNWQQWLNGMAQATKPGQDQYGFVLAAANTHFCYKCVYNMLGLKDGYVFGPNGKIMFNTDNTVQMLDFYKKVWNQTVPDSAVNWSWPQWSRALRQGTCHSTASYTAPVPSMTNQQKQLDTIGQPHMNPVPAQGGPWGEGSPARFVSIDGISVFNEEKMDAIKKWIQFAHEPKRYGRWLRVANPTLFMPAHHPF